MADVCFNCREPLVIWDGDFDAEDYGYDCGGLVHELHCAGCGARITYVVLDECEEEQVEDCANVQTPITAGLREAYRESDVYHVETNTVDRTVIFDGDRFDDLCDNIDSVHAQLERDYQTACEVNERQDADYARLKAEQGEHAYAPESHYMMLPKDADGKPIHLGDTMHGTCPSGKYVCGEVSAIGINKLWLCNVQFSLSPDYMHHYHAPTVEDMLWELLGDIRPDMEDDEAVPIVAAYAKRLRLAGDAE